MSAQDRPARQVLADQIKSDNPDLVVCPWVHMPEQVTPGHPVVAVYRERISRLSTALEHHVKLDVFVSLTDGPAAEDEAEDALDLVLLSLQRVQGCTWQEVQRVTFDGSFAGYTITAAMHSIDVYKSEIAAERRLSLTK